MEPPALPPLLEEIAARVSLDAAIALARAYGGLEIYVPSRPTPDHILVRLLGFPGAEKLAHCFGRTRLPVPRARSYIAFADARRMRSEGVSVPMIARRLGLGERAVWNYVRGVSKGDPAMPEPRPAGLRTKRAEARLAEARRQLTLFG